MAFGYLIGTKLDVITADFAGPIVDSERASDTAYENGLLFNEVASVDGNYRNIDLIVKTIRTRAARLVNEIGPNLPSILQNICLKILDK